MSKRKTWTQEEIDRAIKLYDEGLSFSDIGKELNRHRGVVRNKLKNIIAIDPLVNLSEWTEDEIKEVEQRVKKGQSYKEISIDIGRSTSSICRKLQELGHKKEYPYLYEIGQIVNKTLKIVKQIKVKQGNETVKGYIVKSLAFPNDENDYKIKEGHLKSGRGCAYISGMRVCEDNSLWSNKSTRKYIINEKEAKSITLYSGKEIMFMCPNCKENKICTPDKLIKQGLACQNCSIHTSYPELFFGAYLKTKNIDYKTQISYNEISTRRYDFYIKLNNDFYLVETHGEQHYKNIGFFDYEEIIKSDNIKRNYAYQNNINYIELDCRKSEFEFIKNQINNNKLLPNITKEEEIKISKIIENNKYYPINQIRDLYEYGFSVRNISEEYKINLSTLYRIFKRNNIILKDNKNK